MQKSLKPGNAKAGRRHGPRTEPPAPTRRPEVIKRVEQYISDHPARARGADIRLETGEAIPGCFRWELLRATRTSAFTASGNWSVT